MATLDIDPDFWVKRASDLGRQLHVAKKKIEVALDNAKDHPHEDGEACEMCFIVEILEGFDENE